MANMTQRARAREIRAALALQTSEAELQESIIAALELHRWKWHHETDSRRTNPGWPDLFAVSSSGWWLVLELKGGHGTITQGQLDWLHALGWAHEPGKRGVLVVQPELRRIVGLAYPDQLDDVLEVLAAYR